jgi:hypothetical protein
MLSCLGDEMQKDLLRFEPVTSKPKTTTEILTDVAENASWDPANSGQKHGLVWENRKKLRKLTMTTFTCCSPFYLFYVPCGPSTPPPLSLVSKETGHRDRRPSTTFCSGCLLGWLERARQDINILYWHDDEPNEPTKEGPCQVLQVSPFALVSTVSRGHPSLVSLLVFAA